jgi:hypothetical protein
MPPMLHPKIRNVCASFIAHTPTGRSWRSLSGAPLNENAITLNYPKDQNDLYCCPTHSANVKAHLNRDYGTIYYGTYLMAARMRVTDISSDTGPSDKFPYGEYRASDAYTLARDLN